MIGKILSNRYTIKEKVGSGGMATVYCGRDELLHRDVAIKILSPAHLHDEDSIRKFRREARAAASLSHFNIVSVYDVGQEEDIYYIVMELIKGKTLKDFIKEEGALPVSVALEIGRQICEALEKAHQKGIVHRDIKPHNILLTDEGYVKVTDFGIARAVTSGTVTRGKEIFGSVHYFSPEQARGGTTNAKSDIYSLGVVLYEMVTGKLPFSGETPVSVAVKHLHDDPPQPRQIDPNLPVEVERIILTAMHKDEVLRYQDAASLKKDIEMALRHTNKKESIKALIMDSQDNSQHKEDSVEPERGGRILSSKDKKTQKKKPVWGKVFLAMVLFVAIAGGALYWFLQTYLTVPEVVVPEVVGEHFQTASSQLEQLGLEPKVVATQHHNTIAANHVIRQDPLSGQRVKEGRVIGLTLSEGVQIAKVPDVVNLSEVNARIQLTNSGFDEGVITYQEHETIAKGLVIEQNPKPMTEVKVNTKVDLVISKGPPIREVPVPDLSSRLLSDAKRILEARGLELGEVDEDFSDEIVGTIVRQDPPANAQVNEGTLVDVVISKGPDPDQEPEPAGN